ncbi:MAG: ATP-dependent helicase [Acidimicrobiales bacterium]
MEAAADLLCDLTPLQARAVQTGAAPVCILAGAGAGKTRVLTRRIAYRVHEGDAEADRVLALTFSRKAAAELRQRLCRLGLRDQVMAGTFHAVAAAQLRRWWADRGVVAPTLLERKSRLLAPLAAARPGLRGATVGELAGHVEWAQARLITPDGFADAARCASRVLPVPASELTALYRRYQDEKRRRGLVDFDDLLIRCAEAIEADPAFAGAQRWRWRHLFVDEFQDLNPLQHRLLLAWLGPSSDLCIVGDPQQAIYGWNGADPGLLGAVTERWPGTEVIRLDANHRCSPQIVAAAAAVLGDAGEGLHSACADGPAAEVRSYPSDVGEAHGVAGQLRAAHRDGVRWSEMAVLTRTNAQLSVFQEALSAAGVPFRLAARSGLLDQPSARAVLTQLARRPQVSIQAVVADLKAAADEEGPDDERAALAALADLASDYRRADPSASAAAFVAWLPAAVGDRTGDGAEAVTLSSFHRAKGLEWPAVWVCGLERGLVPIGRASTDAAQAEERRLLYVAVTRAGQQLRCSWAERRSFGGRSVPREPSPWLRVLNSAAEDVAVEPPITPEIWRARLAAQRQRLASGPSRRIRAGVPRWPDPDPGVVAALRSWRADTARASGVPAHVLLHDLTLTALAGLAPQTPADLMAVPGLGPVKAARYGPVLLALVASRAASA